MPVLFLIVATVFSALGQGGGAFYVPLLVASGVPFHEAAAASQSVILAVSLSSMVVFYRAGFLDGKLVLLIEPPTVLGAVLGGYSSQFISAQGGKLIFAAVIFAGAVFLLRPVVPKAEPPRRGAAYWTGTANGEAYSVNWVATLPLMALAGYVAGMLGIGGGLVKVPLMVAVCRIPLRVAVGSSSLMIGITALTGLAGQGLAGHFDARLALPLAAAGFVGAQVGARLSLSVDKRHLQRAFGVLLLVVAVWMGHSGLRG